MTIGTVLVTGAGRGYGEVVARRLAAAGARVGVLGRNADAVRAIAGEIDGVPLVADVLDRRAVDAALPALGPVDVLVNNAGVGGPLGLAWTVDPDDWWSTIEVNLRGTYNVTSLVVPSMIERAAGRIINVVSNAGVARWPHGSAYAVSKSAVIKYGENLAAEVRKHGVVVLNYHPGTLEIGLTGTLLDSDPAEGTVDRMVADWFRGEIAAGRSVDAGASADALVRLARGELAALTGKYITAKDDFDALALRADELARSNAHTLGFVVPE